jgi:ATP-dependent protease ClpP protease subunit
MDRIHFDGNDFNDSKDLFKPVVSKFQSDLYIFSGPVTFENVERFFHNRIRKVENPSKDCTLFLTTGGGDPTAAYRLRNHLKSKYDGKLRLLAYGFCKSAGTLVALGSDEIIMSSVSELGPIDPQFIHRDQLRVGSGLDINSAMDFIEERALKLFHKFFKGIITELDDAISKKAASEFAGNMATGLLTPVTARLDPLQIGDINRNNHIAFEYAKRISIDNDTELASALVFGYPSHEFVIDFKEAKKLFRSKVSLLDKDIESDLEKVFSQDDKFLWTRYPSDNNIVYTWCYEWELFKTSS